MNSSFTATQISPPLGEWPSYLRLCSLDHRRLTELRTTARTRLVESAEQFVLRLNAIAEETDLPPNVAPLLTGNAEEQPIIMTGHQPVLIPFRPVIQILHDPAGSRGQQRDCRRRDYRYGPWRCRTIHAIQKST